MFNHTSLGDRRPSELLNELRHLVKAYDLSIANHSCFEKLFLDKLPDQARTILAASVETNLDSLALRADEVVTARGGVLEDVLGLEDVLEDTF